MREMKVQKQQDTMEEQQELSEGPHSSVDLNESVIFLAPSTIMDDNMDENLDSDDEDYVEDISVEDIPSLYMDWLDEIDREDTQIFAMMMYDIFVQ